MIWNTSSFSGRLYDDHKSIVFHELDHDTIDLVDAMNIEERDKWQDLFQEDPDVVERIEPFATQDQRPVVLMATANLCAMGLNLHRAHHLVKLDVDFLDGGDRQALKRIYQIGQLLICYAWRFITTDNTEHRMVRLRQELRAGIVNEAYKSSGPTSFIFLYIHICSRGWAWRRGKYVW